MHLQMNCSIPSRETDSDLSKSALLRTKILPPNLTASLVERARLCPPEQTIPLVLLCAPAGYGKTTLALNWIRNSHLPSVWISLDAEDNDLSRFLMHFIEAIGARIPGFGASAADVLSSAEPSSIVGLMRPLVNQLCNGIKLLCVLDDMHLVQAPAVIEAISFLLSNLPPPLQVIIASRTEPLLPLSRMRASGQVREYRTYDLRFTSQEIAAFCNNQCHLNLSGEDLASLEARTEGWAVGLHLAAQAIKSRENKTAFIASFAGDDRHIADFLVDEVLGTLSESIQRFLLRTSILDRFDESLAGLIAESQDAAKVIEELERANLFVVALDRRRTWFRYHRLFAELLQARLERLEPGTMQQLHHKAGVWFAERGFIGDAVEHCLKARDYETAASLMEKHGSQLFSHGRFSTALSMCRQLPEKLITRRPVLAVTCAWGSFYANDATSLERYITIASNALADAHSAGSGSAERVMFGQIALINGCRNAFKGKSEEAQKQLTKAVSCFSAGRYLHDAAVVCLGVFYLHKGQLDEAECRFEANLECRKPKRNALVPMHAAFGLARVHALRGDIHLARSVYERGLAVAAENSWEELPACGLLHIGLGALAWERNDLPAAKSHLSRGVELTGGSMQYANTWGRVILAQIAAREGVHHCESDGLDALLWRYAGRTIIDIAPLCSSIGNLWLSQGRLDLVHQWAAAFKLNATEDMIDVEREHQYLVLARLYIASGLDDMANSILDKLHKSASEGKRNSDLLDIALALARAQRIAGDMRGAMGHVNRAVSLSVRTGIIRPFLDAPDLAPLVRKAAFTAEPGAHVRQLLRQMQSLEHEGTALENGKSCGTESLSTREKIVAQHLLRGLPNKQIACALHISPNTLNSHMKSIYAKLCVNSRQEVIDVLRGPKDIL